MVLWCASYYTASYYDAVDHLGPGPTRSASPGDDLRKVFAATAMEPLSGSRERSTRRRQQRRKRYRRWNTPPASKKEKRPWQIHTR